MRQPLRRIGLLSLCGALICAAAVVHAEKPEADLGPALSEREQAFHVLNRLAFGPRPGDVDRVLEMGWESWVRQQLEPDSIDNDKIDRHVFEAYPSLRMTLGETFTAYRPPYKRNESVEDQRNRNQLRERVRRELRDSVLHRAAYSERQFEEVIVEFWRNHFNIDQNKDDVAYLAPNFETQVLRRHAFGKFQNLLLASAQHPAMLTYLDNIVSQKPLSERELQLIERYQDRDYTPRTVAALGRQRGLNENYARELMELHTLGVDRRYKQRDVTEMARILTGWSAGGDGGEYGFRFRRDYHDRDPKRLFGATLRGGGVDQGVAVIRELAKHEYTADFIAYKLCRYLIRDEPSEALVAEIAGVFEETGGDLPEVYEAIIFSDDFMFRQNHRVKFKTPFEFAVSSLRATGATLKKTDPTHGMLNKMGQPIYRCVDPTGYYDQAEAWLDPGVLLHRWTFATRLSGQQLGGIGFEGAPRVSGPDDLLSRLVPGEVDPKTRQEVEEAFAAGGVSAAWAQVLGSPEFQQQ